MKRTASGIVILAILGGVMIGCDTPPGPPAERWNVPKTMYVELGDAEEQEAVTALEVERVSYDHRLQVLQAHYNRIGNKDKYDWTERELANLRQAKTFEWTGTGKIEPPSKESLEFADERVLAEAVVEAREAYLADVEKLAQFYERQGPACRYKAKRVRNMQARFDPIRTYKYFLNAEVGPPDLTPTEVIPAADALFQKACDLHRGGKPLPLVTDYPKQRQALMMFLALIRDYPRSTKIALSAYYIGDIYKEYFNEDVRSVLWYQRAWEWDPNVTEPARFQAATVYDFRLHNKARAVACYRLALQHEQFNTSNVRYSRQRLEELTGQDPLAMPEPGRPK